MRRERARCGAGRRGKAWRSVGGVAALVAAVPLVGVAEGGTGRGGATGASSASCDVRAVSAAGSDKEKPDARPPDKGKAPARKVDVRQLAEQLDAPKPDARRAAVKQLVEVGTRPAWELVVGALGDPEAEVADEAELALARIHEEPLLDALYGKLGLRAKDPWVRLRVAESFGRMGGAVDGLALAKSVDGRDVEVGRALLWSLERRLAAKQSIGDAAKIAHEIEGVWRAAGDPELRGRALIVLERLDHFRALPCVRDALSDREPKLRVAAILAAGGWSEVERLELASRALFDAEACVRSAAIAMLEAIASRPALLQLVHQMEIEKRERLRWGILAYLRARSGEDHGFDADAWRAWAEKAQGPLSTGTEGRKPAPVGDTRVQLAGMTLISDRVIFLVDFSGSTWDTAVGDVTRKEMLDRKLREALEALPMATRFNLVPYTNEPIPWEKTLVPATKANVARALGFFEHCRARGRGNYYDAALLALADPDVDAIVALTDGVPTGGRRYNLPLMVDLLVERARLRQVAFDSILVDAPKARVHDWTALAERTGGRCATVKLE